MADPIETARKAWGDDMPGWIEVLAETCERSSQAAVARQLGVSSSLVSLVLAGKYAGNLTTVEQRVRGALMNATLTCPMLGEMRQHECLDWQSKARKFTATNSLRVRMLRACRACPVARKGD